MSTLEIAGMKIVTDNIYPPIPIRRFDWVAWFDSYGEEGPTAHGETEDEAVETLMAGQGMTREGRCVHCGADSVTPRGCSVGGCPIGNDR